MKLHRNTTPRHHAGFSLAEMMVVIVIIGVLATLVVPNVVRQLGKSQEGKVKSDITQLANAVDLFVIENGGTYPESLEQLIAPPDGGPSYLRGRKSVPLDPWKMPYMYDPPSVTGTGDFRIYTFGKDKAPGGEADNADISNVTILGEEE
jgi:general secretion pathway protein G